MASIILFGSIAAAIPLQSSVVFANMDTSLSSEKSTQDHIIAMNADGYYDDITKSDTAFLSPMLTYYDSSEIENPDGKLILTSLISSASDTPLLDFYTTGQATADSDNDDVVDSNDNCISVANPDQTDADGDKQGDACDSPVLKPQVLNPSIPLDITIENLDNCPSEPNPDQKDSDGDGRGDACDPDALPPGGTTTPGPPGGTTTPPGPTPPQDSIDSDNDGVVDSTYDCLLVNSFKIGKWELLPNPEIGDACDPDAPPIVAAEQLGACSAVATSGPTYIGEDGCPQPCPTDGQDIPTGCPQPVPLDPEAGEEPPVLFKPKRIIIPDDIASGPLIAPPEEAPEPQECGQGEAFNDLTGQCEPEPEPETEDPEEAEEEQQPSEESASEDNNNN